jgi:uncharacterized protein
VNLHPIKKYLLILTGTAALVLGIAGVFIPVLPTTPFLLLASFFYLRSSKRLYKWLINHRIFGSYIYCYTTYKAVTKKTKVSSIVFLWSTLIISITLLPLLYIKVFLVIVGIGVTVHLISLKTLGYNDMKALTDKSIFREGFNYD